MDVDGYSMGAKVGHIPKLVEELILAHGGSMALCQCQQDLYSAKYKLICWNVKK